MSTPVSNNKCSVCFKGFRHNAYRVSCESCEYVAHIECVNIQAADYLAKIKEHTWSCVKCRAINISSSNDTESIVEKSTVEESIVDVSNPSEINNQLASVNTGASNDNSEAPSDDVNKNVSLNDIWREIKCLRSMLDAANVKFDDALEKIRLQSEAIVGFKQLTENLEAENKKLNEELESVKRNCVEVEKLCEAQEQYLRRNTLEIRGVPLFSPNELPEQTLGLVMCIGRALKLNVSAGSIDYCHRLKKRADNSPPTIVVKFLRRFDSRCFLKARRIARNLSCRNLDLDLGSDNLIYVHPSLTAFRSRLRHLASVKKMELKYKWLWVTPDGDIKMRETDTSSIISIREESDLERLPLNS